MIGYPASDYFDGGKGVVLGAYAFGTYAFELESLSPSERIEKHSPSAPRFTRNIERNSTTEWRSHGIAFLPTSAATDNGRKRRGSSIIAISAPLTAAFFLPVNMPPIFRPGRKVRFSLHSMRSGACMSGW